MPKEPLYPHVPKRKAGSVTKGMLTATNANIHIAKARDELALALKFCPILPTDERDRQVLKNTIYEADRLLVKIETGLKIMSEGY